MTKFCFIGGVLAALCGCGSPASSDSHETAQRQEYVKERHENGRKKTVHLHAHGDSLNRIERQFHDNGALLSEGEVVNNKRQGEWRSYHPDGQLWSMHFYDEGRQEGLYRVYYSNGVPRIHGQYREGKEVGEWLFFTETGDTARVKQFN